MDTRNQPAKGTENRPRFLRGKNRRFYVQAVSMLALILTPFGLYAALSAGNTVLSALLFAVIAGTMALVAVLS